MWWKFRAALAALVCCGLVTTFGLHVAIAEQGSGNLFRNAGFEEGKEGWVPSAAGGTEVRFEVTGDEAAEGSRSALLTIGKVESYGCQFGQHVPCPPAGRTYTFAVMGKAIGKPALVQLEIERSGKDYARAARSGQIMLGTGRWTELHVTFPVREQWPEQWFAYVSCSQPNVKFRLDAFRLYEGEYVPFGASGEAGIVPVADVPAEPEPQEAVLPALPAAVRVFDTLERLGGPVAADAPAHLERWRRVPEGDLGQGFKGDAVLLNDRLAIALRRGARGAELYGVRPGGLKLRALLAPVLSDGGRCKELSSWVLRATGPGSVAAALTFQAPGGATAGMRLELGAGHLFVATEPGPGVEGLLVAARCRFGVLPDFFADDIVVDATQFPAGRVELPSENFFLHMIPDRDAIVMAVWTAREHDMHVTIAGEGRDRLVSASELPYGRGGRAYVAVLEGQRLWQAVNVRSSDAGRVLETKWRTPFVAHWRVDWRRDDGLTDSWELALARPGGGYLKPSFSGYEGSLPPDRKRWTTVLGFFQYPCWAEKDGQVRLQPLEKVLSFLGPALIYPINRVKETPLDVFTVTDVVRETLGVGPCQYILDLESQRATRRGRATCATRDLLNDIYARGQQVERRAQVEQALDDVIVFIKHIRSRIEHYVKFGHEVRAYLEQQKAAHPELAGPIDELIGLAAAVDAHVEARRHMIKTPAEAEALADEFRRTLLGYTGPDALEKCKKYTEAWVRIGGNQDQLVGECRLAVKVLAQRAALIPAREPRMAEIARQVRARCRQALKNPTSYEAPRH